MFWFVYNLVFTVGFLALLPKYALRMRRRGGYREGFLERLGIYRAPVRRALAARRRVWVHAVSVGEVFVALRYMEAWRRGDPAVAFALTVNTSTGHAVARARLHPDDVLAYVPVDVPVCVERVLNRMAPRALLLTECELWPNMIRLCRRRAIPVILINGRLSERSYRGYRLARRVFRRVTAALDLMLMQSEGDARRMRALGAPPERVFAEGSAKVDAVRRDDAAERRVAALLHDVGWAGRMLLVGGSTWEGEEALLTDAWMALRKRYPELRLVLAPRHAERAADVARLLAARGVTLARRSTGATPHDPDVLLADTTGELMGFYAAATVVFVGKSLTRHGGQNMIEPAWLGKAVLVGPHTENFPAAMEALRRADAVRVVADAAALPAAVEALLADPVGREAMGRRAREAIESARGVIDRGVARIRALPALRAAAPTAV